MAENEKGVCVMAYGGDFNDRPSDYEFAGMGLCMHPGRPRQKCRK